MGKYVLPHSCYCCNYNYIHTSSMHHIIHRFIHIMQSFQSWLWCLSWIMNVFLKIGHWSASTLIRELCPHTALRVKANPMGLTILTSGIVRTLLWPFLTSRLVPVLKKSFVNVSLEVIESSVLTLNEVRCVVIPVGLWNF